MSTQQSETSVEGLTPPGHPRSFGSCTGGVSPSAFCECLPANTANRLVLAAKELLQVIDQAPIRMAAVACGAELYEKAAVLIDAVAAAETSPS